MSHTIGRVTSQSYRWQAGFGAIAGALVADAIVTNASCWTDAGMRSIDIAEAMLSGAPVPIDLSVHDSVAAAVGLAKGPAPLLVDPTTVAFIDVVKRGLASNDRPGHNDPFIARAAEISRTTTFVDAVAAADGDPNLARMIGAIVGLQGGVGAVPARLLSTFRTSDQRRGRRYLCGLTYRLLGMERPNWYDPRNRRGPKEVLPGLWLSNLFGLSRFTTAHPEGLVLSLCDDDGQIGEHQHHVAFHLDDTPRSDANPRHGASRTGLVLRSLLVDEMGLSADDALTEAKCLWPHTSEWNRDWNQEVDRRGRR